MRVYALIATWHLHKGSIVHLTGVCRVEEFNITGAGFGANPRSFELSCWRSPGGCGSAIDFALVSYGPRNGSRSAAAILLGLALTAFVWIATCCAVVVAEQAAIIRIKVHREAMLEERLSRRARDDGGYSRPEFFRLGFFNWTHWMRISRTEPTAHGRNWRPPARLSARAGEDFRRSLFNLRAEELERATLFQSTL